MPPSYMHIQLMFTMVRVTTILILHKICIIKSIHLPFNKLNRYSHGAPSFNLFCFVLLIKRTADSSLFASQCSLVCDIGRDAGAFLFTCRCRHSYMQSFGPHQSNPKVDLHFHLTFSKDVFSQGFFQLL